MLGERKQPAFPAEARHQQPALDKERTAAHTQPSGVCACQAVPGRLSCQWAVTQISTDVAHTRLASLFRKI